jgi:putative glutamine amidotransferase
MILIGGPDYAAERYGKQTDGTVSPMHAEREEFDFRLGQHLMEETDIPILFVCAAMQWLNIYRGGSLHVHIESAFPGLGLNHRSTEQIPAAEHPVNVVSRSQLMKIYRRKVIPRTVSSHHQSIDQLGQGLVIDGYAPDGIVEAISYPARPFTIGVQWHPEQDYEGNKRLFGAFINAARKARQGKASRKTK